MGRELHREPDARQGDRPGRLDRGHVHQDDEDRPAPGQGPARSCRRCRTSIIGALTDPDIKDLFAYLQSLPPVHNRVPQPVEPTEAKLEPAAADGSGRRHGKAQGRRQKAGVERVMGNRRHFAVIVLIAALTVAGTSWRRALAASPAAHPQVAPDTLMRDRSLRGRSAGSGGRAAISCSRRSTRCGATAPASAGGFSCRRARRSTRRDAYELGLPGRYQVVEGVRVRRPEGGDAVPVEDQRDGVGVCQLRVERGRHVGARRRRKRACREWREIAPGKSAQHPVGHRMPRLPRLESHGGAGLQRAAAVHGSRSECDSWRTARAGHGHAGDAGQRRTPDAGADRIWWRPRRASQAASADERSLLGYLAGNCGVCHNRKTDLAPLGLHWKQGELATAGADAGGAAAGAAAPSGRCRACPKARAC